ncbi:MAG: enolase C-terminal domain-like protein [Deltaproteobacteria bacterium]|nr:enolase C-terminal domain-like protein [Deltaproteobacteria bacterium]
MPGTLELEVTTLDTPRPGLRIVARDGEGSEGVGEGFPLVERGGEDLSAALGWIEALELSGDPLARAREAHALLGPDYPVATFALECALLALAAARAGRPIWALLRGEDPEDDDDPPPVPEHNALLPDDVDLVPAAAAAIAAGFTTLKVKLGRRSFEEELTRLEALRAAVGPRVQLRADVNGAWSLAEAPALLEQLAALELEYLEQPVPAADLPELAASPIPLGADESLADPALADALLESHRAEVWVLKPGALGIHRTLELAMRARAEGLDVVITHAADGAVALEHARQVARALSPFRLACGLQPEPG